ncbi:MAG TPA: hypothetical protein VJ724_06605, partial [Tahibacter sp.]|nr:hypothetical protein [Tahibacter sp.]
MKRIVAVAVAAGLAAAPAAHAAMRLSPQDLGQVLLFPYYTVQNNQSTLIGVVNTTDQPKAFNVQFREARNGNVVAELTLLLGPHDTWNASVVGLAANGPANLATTDRSCTMPYVFNAPAPPGTQPFHAFENTASDGGPTTPARTREGYLQVVEQGVIKPSSPLHALLTSPQGSPAGGDCENMLLDRTDLDPPTGGVYGAF